MLGDHSRTTTPKASKRNYAAVRLLQGAPLLDSDFNEQAEIAHAADAALARDVIGRWGAPHEEAGFSISAGGDGGLTIGAGAFWVMGERVANAASVGLSAQVAGVALPSLGQRLPQFNQTGLAYLEVWRETIDAIDDPSLKEKALGGVATSVRTRIRWRVDVAPLADLQITDATVRAAKTACGPLDVPQWRPSDGALAASLADPAAVADLNCELPPEAGYRSQENQLYCVAIHDGGPRASATFKWSREGGGIVGALRRDLDNRLVVEGAIDDPRLGFRTGDVVEIVDDLSRALGLPGSLRRLSLDPATGEASFTPPLTSAQFDALRNAKLVRWDVVSPPPGQPQPLPVAPAAATVLENGVQALFSDGTYRSGDHWLIPARSATGGVEWPPYEPADRTVGTDDFYLPVERGRMRAPLALVTRRGGSTPTVEIEDVRSIIPALTCLSASDIRVDGGVCQFGDSVVTVQDAINALCGGRRGMCTIAIAPGDDVQAAFDRIPNDQSARVCFLPGIHDLGARIVVRGKGDLYVHGAGPSSILKGRIGAHGLYFEACRQVTIRDLAIRVGDPVGPFSGGIDAAIECRNCGPVDIEAVEATTGSAGSRRIVAIRVAALAGGSDAEGLSVVCEARVARCRITAGDWQMGVQILNPSRAIVEDNVIVPRQSSSRFLRGLRMKNPAATKAMAAAIARIPSSAALAAATGAKVTLGSGAARVTLVTTPRLAEVWARYGANFPAGAATSPAVLASHIRKQTMAAIRGDGAFTAAGRDFRGFEAFIRDLQASLSAVVDGGVVIGGRRIGEVRVAGNRIGPAREGISIAASFSTGGIRREWLQSQPSNVIRRAEVTGNVVSAPSASAMPVGSRHGIEIGHFSRQLLISGNEVDGIAGDDSLDPMNDCGLLVFGWRGRVLSVTENWVSGFARGGTFGPRLAANVTLKMWRIVGNCMTIDRPALTWAGFVESDNAP